MDPTKKRVGVVGTFVAGPDGSPVVEVRVRRDGISHVRQMDHGYMRIYLKDDRALTLPGQAPALELEIEAVDRELAAEPDDGPELPPDEVKALDPWKGRSVTMRCSSCMWYVPKVNDGPPLQAERIMRGKKGNIHLGEYRVTPVPEVGRCWRQKARRLPLDWCGDHKLDESKLEV